MKNRALLTSLLLLFSIILVGCGGGDQANNQTSDQTGQSSSQNNASQDNSQDSSTSSGSSGDSLQLQMNLSEGQSYMMNIHMEDESTESAFGQTVERMTTTEMDLRYDVTDVMPNGNMSVVSTYERYMTRTEAGGQSVQFDSDNPPAGSNSPENRIFGSLIGEDFTLTLSPRAQVVGVSGMDDWLARMMGDIEPSMRQMVEPAFEGIFGEDALIAMMDMAFPAYPQEPVSIGDSWESQSRLNASVPFLVETVFTLESISNGIATLNVSATLSNNPDAEPISIGPVQMAYNNLSGTQEGTLNVDVETGWILSGEINQSFEGELQIIGDTSSIALDNEPIPVTGSSVITYESTEISGSNSEGE